MSRRAAHRKVSMQERKHASTEARMDGRTVGQTHGRTDARTHDRTDDTCQVCPTPPSCIYTLR
eukprot:12076942-Alexandrium_andersonii.AAC.1